MSMLFDSGHPPPTSADDCVILAQSASRLVGDGHFQATVADRLINGDDAARCNAVCAVAGLLSAAVGHHQDGPTQKIAHDVRVLMRSVVAEVGHQNRARGQAAVELATFRPSNLCCTVALAVGMTTATGGGIAVDDATFLVLLDSLLLRPDFFAARSTPPPLKPPSSVLVINCVCHHCGAISGPAASQALQQLHRHAVAEGSDGHFEFVAFVAIVRGILGHTAATASWAITALDAMSRAFATAGCYRDIASRAVAIAELATSLPPVWMRLCNLIGHNRALLERHVAAVFTGGSSAQRQQLTPALEACWSFHFAFLETAVPLLGSEVLLRDVLPALLRSMYSADDFNLNTSAHQLLQQLVTNPSAFRSANNDEPAVVARWHEVVASYIHNATWSFPATTSAANLASGVGAAIGILPHDSHSQAVALQCVRHLTSRSQAMQQDDRRLETESSRTIALLLFNSLKMVPLSTLSVAWAMVEEYVDGIGDPTAASQACALLHDTVTTCEPVRRNELFDRYLYLAARAANACSQK